jgi:hypothetical protein
MNNSQSYYTFLPEIRGTVLMCVKTPSESELTLLCPACPSAVDGRRLRGGQDYCVLAPYNTKFRAGAAESGYLVHINKLKGPPIAPQCQISGANI